MKHSGRIACIAASAALICTPALAAGSGSKDDVSSAATFVCVAVIAAIGVGYHIVHSRKMKAFTAQTDARVLRRESSVLYKPYQVKLVFQYEVDGCSYEGYAIVTAEQYKDDRVRVAYAPDDPGKYMLLS